MHSLCGARRNSPMTSSLRSAQAGTAAIEYALSTAMMAIAAASTGLILGAGVAGKNPAPDRRLQSPRLRFSLRSRQQAPLTSPPSKGAWSSRLSRRSRRPPSRNRRADRRRCCRRLRLATQVPDGPRLRTAPCPTNDTRPRTDQPPVRQQTGDRVSCPVPWFKWLPGSDSNRRPAG